MTARRAIVKNICLCAPGALAGAHGLSFSSGASPSERRQAENRVRTRAPWSFRLPVVLGDTPRTGRPAVLFEAPEREKERSGRDLKNVVGQVTETLHHAPSVHRLDSNDSQHQKIERALDNIFARAGHVAPPIE